MKRIIIAIVSIAFSLGLYAQSEGQKWLADARKGKVKAMFQTAIRYNYGIDGLPKNKQKAIYWAEMAANKGYTDAMVLLGNCYDDLKTKKFDSKKLYWLVKAGQAGNTDGMMHARSSYLLLKGYVTSKSDKIKCVEQQIYWNNRMLEQSDLGDMAREQSEGLVEFLNNELEKIKEND